MTDTDSRPAREGSMPPPLAYVLPHEAWYTAAAADSKEPAPSRRRSLTITWRAGKHTIWEITLVERDGMLDLSGYTSTWDHLSHGCTLLTGLLSGGRPSLAAVRAELDARGAVDETVRHSPYAAAIGS